MATDNPTSIPSRFAHLLAPYPVGSEHIVIAESTSLRGDVMRGMRRLTTALVPLKRLRATLEGPGAQGWLRSEFGDPPPLRKGRMVGGPFALVNPLGFVFEALVDSWTNHNIIVMVPQNRLVATYGLQPRMIEKDRSIRWDDPEHVTYDVVEVHPVSRYDAPNEYSRAEVLLRRDYAEDYADLRSRALVAVYYEQQYVADDPELEVLLDGGEYRRIDIPGVGIEIKRFNVDSEFPFFIAAWGCRFILKPLGRLPISNDRKPTLTWPGFGPANSSRSFTPSSAMQLIYVRDSVLARFEERSEYEVNPEGGYVSYEGRWALSYCHRVGRNFIAYELRKLYEGCPRSVIEHVHRFAADPSEAESERASLGNRNIGCRAARVVAGFAAVSDAIVALANRVGVLISPSDVAKPTSKEIEYSGWWRFPELQPLGRVAPPDMSRDVFLRRTATLYSPLERFHEKPLRRIAAAIGVELSKIETFRSLKLLGLLGQLASTADSAGMTLERNAAAVITRWDPKILLPQLKPLFALNDLRQLASHVPSGDFETNLSGSLSTFDVDLPTMTGGWGAALDKTYDFVGDALEFLAELLQGPD